MKSCRKHIRDLQHTDSHKAQVNRRKRSVAGFGILLACDALARAGNTTTTDVRCDIRVFRGLRRTSPCRVRQAKKEIERTFDLLSYYGHCVHINTAPWIFRRMPAPGMAAAKRIEHGLRFRQTHPSDRRTWDKAFRRDTACKRQKPQKSGPHLSVQPVVESPCSFN